MTTTDTYKLIQNKYLRINCKNSFVAKTQWQQSKNKAPAQHGFGKSPRKSIFGEIAKRSISPGAGAYNAAAIEKSYDKVGSSPLLAKKRH